MIEKIVSGGQTGVDRAALDFAYENNIPCGGWCPQGRIDETGIIPEKYSTLKEVSGHFNSDAENYAERTKCNIRDSDGTLILAPSIPLPAQITDGTRLTIQEVNQNNKPYLIIDLSAPQQKNAQIIKEWIDKHKIKVLNIGGPRESSYPGIYTLSLLFLRNTLIKNGYKPR